MNFISKVVCVTQYVSHNMCNTMCVTQCESHNVCHTMCVTQENIKFEE